MSNKTRETNFIRQSATDEFRKANPPRTLRLVEIAAALPKGSPLKSGGGQLKQEAVSFAANIADIAGYKLTVHGKETTYVDADSEAILDHLKADRFAGPQAMEELRAFSNSLSAEFEKIDGRQTDYDDIQHWNARNKIVDEYRREITGRSPSV